MSWAQAGSPVGMQATALREPAPEARGDQPGSTVHEVRRPIDAPPAVAHRSAEEWVRGQRVTVLMATFNRAHFIEEALDSLLHQTRPPDEIIVVDDGSTDDTAARVRRYGDRLRYIAKPNGGKSSALNRGLREASGDWIWCFDDDDAALPDGLEKLLRAAAAERDADFVYGGQATGHTGNDGRIVIERAVLPADVPAESLFAHGLRTIPFLMPAALVRRARCQSLGGFDERYARSQDYEFLLRLVANARGVRVEAPIFVWRSHDGPRGPHHLQHDVALRERVWMEVAGRLGRELRRRLPLAAYLHHRPKAQSLDMRSLRRALLERMSVMASKGLVRETLADLHSAATLLPDAKGPPLDREEAQACWDVANFPFFQMRLLDAPDRVVARLLTAAESRMGRAMLARIARGVFYAARHADATARQRRLLVRCALRLFFACGPWTAVRAYLPAAA